MKVTSFEVSFILVYNEIKNKIHRNICSLPEIPQPFRSVSNAPPLLYPAQSSKLSWGSAKGQFPFCGKYQEFFPYITLVFVKGKTYKT